MANILVLECVQGQILDVYYIEVIVIIGIGGEGY